MLLGRGACVAHACWLYRHVGPMGFALTGGPDFPWFYDSDIQTYWKGDTVKMIEGWGRTHWKGKEYERMGWSNVDKVKVAGFIGLGFGSVY